MPMLRAVLLAMLPVLPMREAAAQGLLPELDTSSPLATHRTFLAGTARLQQPFQACRAQPTLAGEIALGLVTA
jgi:hypothetical protein